MSFSDRRPVDYWSEPRKSVSTWSHNLALRSDPSADQRRAACSNLHHYFAFRDGKISYYRGTEDVAQTEEVRQA